ncbi:hypothetical protein KY319_05110 [Candidatus Woesearchaeota archaeon]|nr:hypothetical protein [Candidatus Woesearchaeota archaeon]
MRDINEKLRKALKSQIELVEQLGDSVKLADLYLEYALLSRGAESVLYAHKAVALNPEIHVSGNFSLNDIRELNNLDEGERLVLEAQYSGERSPVQIKVIESFLDGIKDEAKKRPDALEVHESLVSMVYSGKITDPHNYRELLSEASDESLVAERRRIAKQETGVNSFLSDILLSREQDKRDRQRWKRGDKMPVVTLDQVQDIFSPDYPKHVVINEEVLGCIKSGCSRSYGSLDRICDAICAELAKRLPRRLDAYRYRDDTVEEVVEVEGLGKIKLKLRQTGNGVFSYVSDVQGENFRIHNRRLTGRAYLGLLNDVAWPSDIEIKPLDLKVSLYDDDSGIFVKTRGLEYSNSGVDVFGVGRNGDSRCDDLYPTKRSFEKSKDPEILNALRRRGIVCIGRLGAEIFHSFRFSDLVRDKKKYFSFIGRLGKPLKLRWNDTSEKMVGWLRDNVLNKITAAPVYEQATTLPEPVPYPLGALYAWTSAQNASKIELTGGDPGNAYFHERFSVAPRWRLAGLGVIGDFPKEAYWGFIWCGIGEPKPNASFEDYEIPGHWDFERGDKLLRVMPKHGEDIFVVDYQAYDDFREEAFKTTNRLSDAQMHEMSVCLAKTLVPVNQYKGNYKKPVVLVGRNLEFDEAKIVPGVEYNPDV